MFAVQHRWKTISSIRNRKIDKTMSRIINLVSNPSLHLNVVLEEFLSIRGYFIHVNIFFMKKHLQQITHYHTIFELFKLYNVLNM